MSNFEKTLFYSIIFCMFLSCFCGIMAQYEKQKRIKNIANAIEQVFGNK